MIDRAQVQFLLTDESIDKISGFLSQRGYTNVRICFPSTSEQNGKIVLLLCNPKKRDDYTNCKDIHDLKKAIHYKKLDFMIEERLKKTSISRIVDPSIPLTKMAIQQLSSQINEYLEIDFDEDESNNKVFSYSYAH